MAYTQLDIAPTISRMLHFEIPDHDGEEISEILAYSSERAIDQIALVVIDGIGVTLYDTLKGDLSELPRLAADGLFFEIESLPPRITTPNIATILSGYTPEHHQVCEPEDTFYTPVKMVLERASDNGVKSGIVIEVLGAKAMQNRVDVAIGVENTRGIIDYDRRIVDLALKAFTLEALQLLTIHLRAIDNCVHHFAQSWDDVVFAAQTIDKNVERFISGLRKPTLLMITSDHPIHVDKWTYLEGGNTHVPLIVDCVDASSRERMV
ncbi:MAG: alkaline phosphatase family protein [Halobacteriota archaeon]